MSLRGTVPLTATIMLAAVATAHAAPFSYSDFSSTAGLQLNGAAAAATDGGGRKVLRVTPSAFNQSGSAFSTTAISLSNAASFSTFFNFNINTPDGIGDDDGQGADGLVFVVQPNSNSAGGAGGGLGYDGIDNSIGIEFDTYNNGFGDADNGNHVGVDWYGFTDSIELVPVATRFNDGDDWSVWIDYDGASQTLEVRLAFGLNAPRPSDALISTELDLADILGTTDAYVGFTSGTGSGYGNHDIVSWQFNDDFAPIGAPAPFAVALLGLGILGLGGLRRFR